MTVVIENGALLELSDNPATAARQYRKFNERMKMLCAARTAPVVPHWWEKRVPRSPRTPCATGGDARQAKEGT